MLVQLTVRSRNFKNVTAYTESFDSEKIHRLRDNQSTGAIPVLNGQTEFVYAEQNGVDTFYTVVESIESVVNAAGGVAATAPNYGTAEAGVIATEQGDGLYHKTTLTVDTYTETIVGANLALGEKLYTFPTGGIIIHGGTLDVTMTAASETDAPIIGIGTVIGTGGVAILSGTDAFEDIMNGVAGTAIASGGGQTLRVWRAELDATNFDGHTTEIPLFFNFASSWTQSEDITIFPLIITINWAFLGDV